jgi:hypothetical protein
MEYRIVVRNVAAAALLAGSLCLARPALAQTATPGIAPGAASGSPIGTPFLSPANSIVPNANNITSGPFTNFTGTPFTNGFSPFFGNPFVTNPFFANPFFSGFGPGLVYSPPTPGALNPLNYAAPPPTRGGPLLGVNTPPHTAGGGPVPYVRTHAAVVVPMPLDTHGGAPASTDRVVGAAPGTVSVVRSSGPMSRVVTGSAPVAAVATGSAPRAQRVRGSRTTTVARRPAARTVRTAGRMERIMRREPMISGRLVSLSASSALVRVKRNGKWVTRRYAPANVFFFRGDDILDAASARKQLKRGAAVLVPEQTTRVV